MNRNTTKPSDRIQHAPRHRDDDARPSRASLPIAEARTTAWYRRTRD